MATVVATPRHHPRITARPVVLAVICLAAAAFITYMVLEVPVAAPLPHGHVLLFCPIAPLPLPRAQISGHWPLAVVAAAVVLAVDAAALTVMRRHRTRRDSPSGSAHAAAASRPSPLRLERVPVRAVAIAGAASLTLLIAGFSRPDRLTARPPVPTLHVQLPRRRADGVRLPGPDQARLRPTSHGVADDPGRGGAAVPRGRHRVRASREPVKPGLAIIAGGWLRRRPESIPRRTPR